MFHGRFFLFLQYLWLWFLDCLLWFLGHVTPRLLRHWAMQSLQNKVRSRGMELRFIAFSPYFRFRIVHLFLFQAFWRTFVAEWWKPFFTPDLLACYNVKLHASWRSSALLCFRELPATSTTQSQAKHRGSTTARWSMSASDVRKIPVSELDFFSFKLYCDL